MTFIFGQKVNESVKKSEWIGIHENIGRIHKNIGRIYKNIGRIYSKVDEVKRKYRSPPSL